MAYEYVAKQDKDIRNEKNIPTTQHTKKENTRFQNKNEDKER